MYHDVPENVAPLSNRMDRRGVARISSAVVRFALGRGASSSSPLIIEFHCAWALSNIDGFAAPRAGAIGASRVVVEEGRPIQLGAMPTNHKFREG